MSLLPIEHPVLPFVATDHEIQVCQFLARQSIQACLQSQIQPITTLGIRIVPLVRVDLQKSQLGQLAESL